ncbi:MAG: hypothetical protein K2K98_01765 [Muribaculaceae bacterium]|nr:hypothetical protein [Muribaculaceae bacterium]
MKKFTTDLSKSFSAIAIAITMLAYTFSASADEYKSMIRYDRVWECVSYEDNHDVIKCMKFAGQEKIAGKIYHRIVSFRKTIADYVDDDLKYEMIEDIAEHEGYLREEDGVVFTLVQKVDNGDKPRYGYLYIPDENNPDIENVEVSEQKLYDFTLHEGDLYDGFSFVMKGGDALNFYVRSTSDVKIAEEECRSINVVPSEFAETYPDLSYQIIEGIGAVTEGCLNYHEFIIGVDQIWYHKKLSRVFDLDGNVIFNTGAFKRHNIDYNNFASVKDVHMQSTEADSPLYDILGRRITAPAPDQLYIQGGKKHIAR